MVSGNTDMYVYTSVNNEELVPQVRILTFYQKRIGKYSVIVSNSNTLLQVPCTHISLNNPVFCYFKP